MPHYNKQIAFKTIANLKQHFLLCHTWWYTCVWTWWIYCISFLFCNIEKKLKFRCKQTWLSYYDIIKAIYCWIKFGGWNDISGIFNKHKLDSLRNQFKGNLYHICWLFSVKCFIVALFSFFLIHQAKVED